jgi:hypothetical protein
LGAATALGVRAQLLVCEEDRTKVRGVEVSSCKSVVAPNGQLDNNWVLPVVEVFGAEQEKQAEQRRGGSWALTVVDFGSDCADRQKSSFESPAPSPAAPSGARASELEQLSLSNDPAVQETWKPREAREKRHDALVNAQATKPPPERAVARKGHARASKKKSGCKRREREQEVDESVNETTNEQLRKARTSEPPPQAVAETVQEVGQKLAQLLQGANIGKVEFNFNIFPK